MNKSKVHRFLATRISKELFDALFSISKKERVIFIETVLNNSELTYYGN